MGYERTAYGYHTIGDVKMNPEIKIGSLAMSESSSEFVNSLVDSNNSEATEYRPFSSIVEGFRFAFTVGFLNGVSRKRVGNPVTVAPRFFISRDYYDLLKEESINEKKSLGQLISDYAEGGVELMKTAKTESSILELLS